MQETQVQALGWEDTLEKEMAIHSSTFAWKIPWTEEPGRLQSVGSQSQTRLKRRKRRRILHRLASTVAQLVKKLPANAGGTREVAQSLIRKIPWRRKWHPTPVLLPGKSHGRRSLVGYSPWGHKDSDMTEQLHFLRTFKIKLNHFQYFIALKM